METGVTLGFVAILHINKNPYDSEVYLIIPYLYKKSGTARLASIQALALQASKRSLRGDVELSDLRHTSFFRPTLNPKP